MRIVPLLMAVLAARVASAEGLEGWERRIAEAVVQIEPLDATGQPLGGCGVGTLIAPGAILTAHHVVEPEGLGVVGGYRLHRYGAPAPVTVMKADARGVLLETGGAQWQWLDVAVMRFDPEKLDAEPAPLGWVSDSQLRSEPEGNIVSFHQGPCQGAGETGPAGSTWLSTHISPPRPNSVGGPATRRLVLSGAETAGYSGSPVISRSLRRVIGVYTSGDARGNGEGYATSLADAREVLSGVLREPLQRAWSTPHRALLYLGVNLHERWGDSQLRSRIPTVDLGARFYVDAVGPWWDEHLWLVAGGFVSMQERVRMKVLDQYPGLGVREVEPVSQPLLTLSPSVALRWEVSRFALTADPGVRFRFVFGEDAQRGWVWEPGLEASARLLPLRQEGPSGWSLGIIASVSRTLAGELSVLDYHFDLSGTPGTRARLLQESGTRFRIALEVGH
jgi:hypothetical protein